MMFQIRAFCQRVGFSKAKRSSIHGATQVNFWDVWAHVLRMYPAPLIWGPRVARAKEFQYIAGDPYRTFSSLSFFFAVYSTAMSNPKLPLFGVGTNVLLLGFVVRSNSLKMFAQQSF